jgi:hypothetical protein
MEGLSSGFSIEGSRYNNAPSGEVDHATQNFMRILEKCFSNALERCEEISPGVYTTKTDPTFASYQNYGNKGTIA